MKKAWKKTELRILAKKHKFLSSFRTNVPGPYRAALKLDVLDKLGLIRVQKPRGYWTKERCAKIAKRFQTKSEFRRKASSAYEVSKRNSWLKAICSHMKSGFSSNGPRQIYAFEFHDLSVYVGLAKDVEIRRKWHLKHSSRIKAKIKESGKYKFVILSPLIDESAAAELEVKMIRGYRSRGYAVLNKVAAGGLGGTPKKITKRECKEVAQKYDTRTKFFKSKHASYYHYARRQGWLREICSHMRRFSKPSGYWTPKRLEKSAKRFKSVSEFRNKAPLAYKRALSLGLLQDLTKSMTRKRRNPDFYNLENVKRELKQLKIQSISQLKLVDINLYSCIVRKGWSRELLLPLKRKRFPNGYWTFEQCQKEAKRHADQSSFRINSPSAYRIAARNNWIRKIFVRPRSSERRTSRRSVK